ncbi:MAG: hypothetical protein NTU44_13260 [Bacteroidetes bacterium]|nr:hypothetical protein [Bacteroidota bacterium]
MLGVCAGSLSSEGVSVTSIAENMDDSEIGGYPSAIQDNTGLRWVFWESSSLGVLEGDRQKILGSVFDPVSGKWTPSFSLPTVSNTFLNQTPQAVSTPSGNIWVTWSGRTPKENWVLNLACYSNDKWSMPVSITTGKDPARAPKIIADNNQGVWVVCHYGQREKMKIKVENQGFQDFRPATLAFIITLVMVNPLKRRLACYRLIGIRLRKP